MSCPWARTQARASCEAVHPLLGGDRLDPLDQFEVLGEVLALEPGRVLAVVVGGEVARPT